MNMVRGKPESTPDSLAAFIELAKDPAAFEAKLAALRDVETAAKASLEEMAAKRIQHVTREQALNDREAALTSAVKDLAVKARAHSDRIEAFQKDSVNTSIVLDRRQTALDERAANVKAAEDAAGKKQADAENRLRAADDAWNKAATLHDKLLGITAQFDDLKSALAGIG